MGLRSRRSSDQSDADWIHPSCSPRFSLSSTEPGSHLDPRFTRDAMDGLLPQVGCAQHDVDPLIADRLLQSGAQASAEQGRTFDCVAHLDQQVDVAPARPIVGTRPGQPHATARSGGDVFHDADVVRGEEVRRAQLAEAGPADSHRARCTARPDERRSSCSPHCRVPTALLPAPAHANPRGEGPAPGAIEPMPHGLHCIGCRQWPDEDTRPGGIPHESEQGNPRHADARRRRQRRDQPATRQCVLWRVGVDRIQQHVGVRQPHRPRRSLASNCSSSSCSATRFACSRSTLGRPM